MYLISDISFISEEDRARLIATAKNYDTVQDFIWGTEWEDWMTLFCRDREDGSLTEEEIARINGVLRQAFELAHKEPKIYAIYTGNGFNQVLLWSSYSLAREWAQKATRWTEEEIAENIKEARPCGDGMLTIFDICGDK